MPMEYWVSWSKKVKKIKKSKNTDLVILKDL